MVVNLLENACRGMAAMLFVYIIGKIACALLPMPSNRFFKLFVTYAAGILIILLAYSFIRSGLKTINLLILPEAAILLFLLRKRLTKPRFHFKEIKQELFYSLLAFFPVFAYQAYFYFDFANDGFKPLYSDQYFYAQLANSLKLFGAESANTGNLGFNYFFEEFRNYLTPYHYGELWLTAFFSSLFRINTISSYYLITNTVLVSVYYIGLLSLFDRTIKTLPINYIISFLCLFISGITFDFYEKYEISRYAYWCENPIFGLFTQKYAIAFIYLLLSFLLLEKKHPVYSMLVLSIVPILSLALLPAVFGGLVLFGVYRFLTSRFRLSREIITCLAVGLANLGIFMAFYYYFNQSHHLTNFTNNTISDTFLNKLLSNTVAVTDMKIFAGNFISRIVKPIVFYLPLLAISVFSFKMLKRKWTLLLFCVLSGIFASCLLYNTANSSQFASGSYIFFNIVIAMSLARFLENSRYRKSLKYLIMAVFIVFVLIAAIRNTAIKNSLQKTGYLKHNPARLKQIAGSITKKNAIILVYLNAEDYGVVNADWWIYRNNLLPLHQYSNKDIAFILANYELYYESRGMPQQITTAVQKWCNDRHAGIEALIKTFDIRYVYAKRDIEIPSFINNTATTQLPVSKNNNDVFYVLR